MEHFYQNIKGAEASFTFPNLYRKMIENARDGGSICEVGVWRGASLAFLAAEAQRKNLTVVGVDYFAGMGPWGSADPQKQVLKRWRREEAETPQWNLIRENMAPAWDSIVIVKALSHQAASFFKDGQFDGVMIDADHSYEACAKDIRAWLPKVREGGILAGHDYQGEFPGVDKAVNEWAEETGRTIESGELCWWTQL